MKGVYHCHILLGINSIEVRASNAPPTTGCDKDNTMICFNLRHNFSQVTSPGI